LAARALARRVEFDEDVHSIAGDDALVASMSHAHANPEAAFERRQDVRILDEALAALPDEFREALVLREIEDLSYKEIASALGIPIGTVMSRIARARRLLLDSFRRLTGDHHEMRRSDPAAGRIR
jgi:RNA polymerase sigma-70 factor (ECF subfamily)